VTQHPERTRDALDELREAHREVRVPLPFVSPLSQEDLADVVATPFPVERLTEEQKGVFDKVLSWLDVATTRKFLQNPSRTLQVTSIGGYAGTGKSTLVAVLGQALERAGMHPLYLSYTGKAVNVLRKKLREAGLEHIPARTVHSSIYRTVLEDDGRVSGFRLLPAATLEDYDVLVLDEASMIDEKMFTDLLSFGRPILAVGDHGQLPPVQGMGSLMRNPQHRLETVHRQAVDNPILDLATRVRLQGRIPPDFEPRDERVTLLDRKNLVPALHKAWEQYGPEEVVILTYTNANRCHFNRVAQQQLYGNPGTLQKGSIVINLRNHENVLFNGMRGRVTSVAEGTYEHRWRHASVLFADDLLQVDGHLFEPQLNRAAAFESLADIEQLAGHRLHRVAGKPWAHAGLFFDFGYALTVHKSQGSSFKHVFLHLDIPPAARGDGDNYRRWLYTAVTRSSEKLTVFL